MKRRKKERTYLLLGLVLLTLTLGYAFLQVNLSINGTTNVSSANWNIYLDNIQFGSNNVMNVTTPATINAEKTEVSFNVSLKKPGDTYEFTVDAVNDGTIDAMIGVVTNGVYGANGTTPKTLPDYLEYTVTYSDGGEVATNQLLASGARETYKVKVHYKEDITPSQLPSTADNFVFKFSVTYVQATNAATNRFHYVYTVNKYDETVTSPKYNGVWLNQTFPTNIAQYNTSSEVLSAITTIYNMPFYLKHKIVNGVVTESYAEFVVTEEMAQANSGMVPGVYTLKGETTYDDNTSTWLVDENYISPYYEVNKEIIKRAYGYNTHPERCSETGTGLSAGFFCGASGMNVGTDVSGYSSTINTTRGYCSIGRYAYSCCRW